MKILVGNINLKNSARDISQEKKMSIMIIFMIGTLAIMRKREDEDK